MAVIYVSALGGGGVKVKISSYESGWRSSEFWTLTATCLNMMEPLMLTGLLACSLVGYMTSM